jgi:hypothetical protein
MKNVFIFLTFVLANAAHAESWQKIVSCENGAAVIDVNADERRNLQLVLRGNDLLSRLYDARMVSLQYGQQELVIRGWHSELRQTSPTYTRPELLNGVFAAADFRKMIQEDWNGNTVQVEMRGNDLAIQRLHYSAGESCEDTSSGECRGGVEHKTYYFDREYVLHGCSLQ